MLKDAQSYLILNGSHASHKFDLIWIETICWNTWVFSSSYLTSRTCAAPQRYRIFELFFLKKRRDESCRNRQQFLNLTSGTRAIVQGFNVENKFKRDNKVFSVPKQKPEISFLENKNSSSESQQWRRKRQNFFSAAVFRINKALLITDRAAAAAADDDDKGWGSWRLEN